MSGAATDREKLGKHSNIIVSLKISETPHVAQKSVPDHYKRSRAKLELKPIKLGKNIELKYIPFSELAIPWNVCIDSAKPTQYDSEIKQPGVHTLGTTTNNSKPSKTIKHRDIDDLRQSIAQYGLLRPFEVTELPERLDFFYAGKGKYLVIDGQRRYFAIKELLRLPSEHGEKTQKDNLRTNSGHDQIDKAEAQAQEQFNKLSIRDYVLIPCLVYPYNTFLQSVRHSIEDKRFSTKPSRGDLKLADKMRQQGVQDITTEDLTELLEIRSKIEEERQAIEKTLKEIRNKTKEPTLLAQGQPTEAHT